MFIDGDSDPLNNGLDSGAPARWQCTDLLTCKNRVQSAVTNTAYWNEMASVVKPSRGYDASGRRAQAGRTRTAVLETAQRLFLANGYVATTIATIAAEAGVSVETIYKAFGNKPGVVRAIHERALAGDESLPTSQRSDDMRARETDPRRVIQNWGSFATQVMPRVAPILLLVRSAAATAPELSVLWEELEDQRLTRMADNARYFVDGGHLREGCTQEEARDVLWAYTSPELYERLVLRQGWTVARWGQFVSEGIIAALLAT
ncbi:MAG: TetR/AcrR family transcriptional regulator [Candidatus Limnocylindria bacterium]